jgi:cation transport protein ChaC
MHEIDPALVLRDPTVLFAQALRTWGGHEDLWVFGYGSLIWRPEFESLERRMATVHGYHRSFRMHSRINRGTPQCPGLVFALVHGGCCRGVVYRIARERAPRELERLWAREMMTGVYDARWLPCRTPQGPVQALAFTLDRRSPNYTGPIPDERLVPILREAAGRYGRTLDYLMDTAHSLTACGIRDREIDRLVALARRHALVR